MAWRWRWPWRESVSTPSGCTFMEALAGLWSTWGGELEDVGCDDDDPDPWDTFYRDLENLMRQRPRDPFKAFGKLLRRHGGEGRGQRAHRHADANTWAEAGWVGLARTATAMTPTTVVLGGLAGGKCLPQPGRLKVLRIALLLRRRALSGLKWSRDGRAKLLWLLYQTRHPCAQSVG